jgi:hypothetical protein
MWTGTPPPADVSNKTGAMHTLSPRPKPRTTSPTREEAAPASIFLSNASTRSPASLTSVPERGPPPFHHFPPTEARPTTGPTRWATKAT